MDDKKSLELIKLEVLGCLNQKDSESLQKLKDSNGNFPWKQLAEYQKLVALLPSILEIKFPDSELKDKTAMKLYNIREEIKAKIEAKKPKEVLLQPTEEKVEEQVEEHVEIKEEIFIEAEEGIQLDEEKSTAEKKEPFRIQSNVEEKKITETLLHEFDDKHIPVSKVAVDKEQVEKIARDYIKLHFESELDILSQKIKKNMILSIVFFIITLGLIAGLYFIK